ncbi:MAG: sulfite exporter TauE/SafE family protein [Caldimonas sp.]
MSISLGLTEAGALPISAIVVTVFAAGLLRGFSGFGSSLLLVPVLAPIVGTTRAVVISTLLEGLATIMLIPSNFRHADRNRLVAMGTAACLAIPAGHFALLTLDPTFSNLAISAAVVLMVGVVWRGATLRLPRGTSGEVATGLVSGFLTGFGSIGGPPLVLYILAGPGAARQKRADVIVVAGFAQGVALVSMIVFGLLTLAGAGDAALLAPVFFSGGVLGARLFKRASERTYQRVALGALFGAAVGLLCMNVVKLLR